MKFPTTFRWLFGAVLTATLTLLALNTFVFGRGDDTVEPRRTLPNTAPAAAPNSPQNTSNKIQIAFLLDTSGSMDGLIDQAKARLWSILNEAMKVERNGEVPEIEVALYQYGNDNLSLRTNYVQQILGLTSDVDDFSEKLFALATNGGEEYCGAAVKTAALDLNWDSNDGTVKLIYIAGNEPFDQGPIAPEDGLTTACEKGITVNTILCNDPNGSDGITWKSGAKVCKGDFFAINQDESDVYVESPYDARIEQLNAELNRTYVPINAAGAANLSKQQAQDVNAEAYSKANLSSRAKYKASKNYKNSSWDLVDAAEVDVDKVIENKAALPDSLKILSEAALTAKIHQLSKNRLRLKTELTNVAKERDAYVVEAKKKSAAEETNTLGDRLKTSVKKKLLEKGYKEVEE